VVKVEDLDEELLSSAVLGDETVVVGGRREDAAHLERFLRGEESGRVAVVVVVAKGERLDALGVGTY
jgi:hypothetical protein